MGSRYLGRELHLLVGVKSKEEALWEKLTRREYALIACALSALALAVLPLLLHLFGTRWRPGTRGDRANRALIEGEGRGDIKALIYQPASRAVEAR